jgi:hypothetical protein
VGRPVGWKTTVPIRPGQRQGFFIQVFNFTP